MFGDDDSKKELPQRDLQRKELPGSPPPKILRKAFPSFYPTSTKSEDVKDLEELSDEDALKQLRFPPLLLNKVKKASWYGITLAFRVNPAGTAGNRRNSTLGAPKNLDEKTKTNAKPGLALGHIPELQALLVAPLNILDHQKGAFITGSMPIKQEDVNQFKKLYRDVRSKFMSQNGKSPYGDDDDKIELGEIKVTPDGRMTYSVTAPEYNLVKDDKGGTKKVRNDEGSITKHYVQETESLLSIITNLNNGVYEDHKLIQQKDGTWRLYVLTEIGNQQQKLEFDLSKLISPPEGIDIKRDPPEESLIKEQILNVLKNKDMNQQVPVAFRTGKDEHSNESYFPVMVQAGSNGEPITGDADASYIALPLNMPNIAFKSYNGLQGSTHADIVNTFEIMIKRLMLDNNAFKTFIDKKAKDTGKDVKSLISKYDMEFTPDDAVKGIIKELQKTGSGQDTVADTLIKKLKADFLSGDKQILNRIGTMSMGDLLVNLLIDDPNLIHGKETKNPSPEPITGVLHVYQGKLYRSNTERGYLDFLMKDPKNLANYSLDFHPSYIRDRTKGPEYERLGLKARADSIDLTNYWLDVIEIQALHYIKRFKEADRPEMLSNFMDRNTKEFEITYTDAAIGIKTRIAEFMESSTSEEKRLGRLDELIFKRTQKHDPEIEKQLASAKAGKHKPV